MIIYLAELSHTGKNRSPNTVPLAAGHIAAYSKKIFPDIEIVIFRDPNALLNRVKYKKPHVVGFSIYAWSENLSNFCAQRIKAISSNTIIAAGGPSIDDIDSEILKFLQSYPYYDICCPNEGEISFVNLIDYLINNGNIKPDEMIGGCARLTSNNSLIRGAYNAPKLSDIPSPYLDGFMDPFLSDNYIPVIQSMRGCPYGCKFCVSGNSLWSKIESFELGRVFAEIEYVYQNTKNQFMILTDENLGILKDRDVTLSEYIIKSYRDRGFPSRIYFYTAKIITQYVLSIVKNLRPIGEFCISFQTLNKTVKKTIKRTNNSWSNFIEALRWADKNNIITSTEMIFGFPFETVATYLEGIEQLIRSGVDRVYSYNLRLFNGIDLSTSHHRDEYNYKTSYRLMENTFGLYENTLVAEVEEVVVNSNTFNYDDYLTVRVFGLFLELASGRGYLSEIISLMIKHGLPGEKLISFLANYAFGKHKKMSLVLDEYIERSKKELFDSPEQCIHNLNKLITNGIDIPEVKLNFIYTGKIMLNIEIRKELFEVVKEFIKIHSENKETDIFFNDYVDNILSNQIVSFSSTMPPVIHSKSKININKLNNTKARIRDILKNEPTKIEFALHKDTIDFMKYSYDVNQINNNDEMIQNIYSTVSRFGLIRTRKQW